MSLYAVVAQSDTMLVNSSTLHRPDDHARNLDASHCAPIALLWTLHDFLSSRCDFPCRSREQVDGGTHDVRQTAHEWRIGLPLLMTKRDGVGGPSVCYFGSS